MGLKPILMGKDNGSTKNTQNNTLSKDKPKKKKVKNTSKEMTVEEKYNRMSHHEHVLKRPDSYVGSVKTNKRDMDTYSETQNCMVMRTVKYNQALYKIFDEIIVNARDRIELDTCDKIKIDINRDTGYISVWNNGQGIPVEMHKTEKKWVPHMILGCLLTSENYKTTGKTTGGKNGYGAKCTNIYSKEFLIETVNSNNKKKYVQRFYENMYKFDKAKVTSSKAEPYCKITFKPDYEKFGMKELSNDMYGIFIKRCYDLIATSPKRLRVWLNGKELKCKKFEDYVKLYYPNKKTSEIIYERVNSRWKVCFVFARDINYKHSSFVNGICTIKGGTHVDMITKNITDKVKDFIRKKPKYKDYPIKPAMIKEHMHLFVDCIIEDPSFEAQTKEVLTSKPSEYGEHRHSVCKLSEDFIKNIVATGLEEEVVKFAEYKVARGLTKSDGVKTTNLSGIPKLDDAHQAGSRNAHKCTLYITEGDSAKTFALWGIKKIGKDYNGVFPIKGKFLNVRGATKEQLKKNKEFEYLKLILGLKQECTYEKPEDVKKLRYGYVNILTDQDVDGSHIKGLLIAFFEFFWPHLIKCGYVQTLNTPIVKAWKKTDKKMTKCIDFYTDSEYRQWKTKKENSTGADNFSKWNTKYFKGLGTSTCKIAQECFDNIEKKIITYCDFKDNDKKSKKDAENETDKGPLTKKTSDIIKMAFNQEKGYSTKRKEWLSEYDENEVLSYDKTQQITIEDFIHKDFKHFSMYSCQRALPSVMDGLKPSQRKIMFAFFKRGRNAKEIKVAQMGAYVAQHTEYHHGEDSLKNTIVGMARPYCGSNNINLLYPNGNFGTRKRNGKDAASPRYIFTQLEAITSKLFRVEDECVLDYLVEDGTEIEPKYYAPILPVVLINGTAGIGTGHSSTIPTYDPLDISKNIRRKIKGDDPTTMKPYFKGFLGTVTKLTFDKYEIEGVFEVVDSHTVNITELPVGSKCMSIDKYKEHLESLMPKKKDDNSALIVKFDDNSGNNTIDFKITFQPGVLKGLVGDGYSKLKQVLRLKGSVSLNNLTLYNAKGVITKYGYPEDIINAFYEQRYKVYEKRRLFMIAKLKNLLNIIDYKIKYIKEYKSGKIKVTNNSMEQLTGQVVKREYPRLSENHTDPEYKKSYKYLFSLYITSLTTDKINELLEEQKKRKKDLDDYTNITIEELWLREIDEFEKMYKPWLKESIEALKEDDDRDKKGKSKGKTKGKAKGKAKDKGKGKN